MALELEAMQFGGKVIAIAEKEFSASFTEDTNSTLVMSLWQEYVEEGKPSSKIAWIRKRLEKLFLYVSQPPVWVEKRTTPRWPFLNGKPMVFICQYALVDTSVVRDKFVPGLVIYLFADRQPAAGGGEEMCYRAVEQDSSL